MDISVIPGATCAVVRIKIDAFRNGTRTYFAIDYKKSSSYTWISGTEMNCENKSLYGSGPMFYDLTGLEPETEYDVRLRVASGDASLPTQVAKTFTTCALGDFEFKDSRIINYDGSDTSGFAELLDWFKNNMIAVGYDYKITEERSPNPYNDGTYFSAKVYVNADEVAKHGASAFVDGGYKGDIIMCAFNSNHRHVLVHEYMHYLGLAGRIFSDDFLYHGDDPCEAGFDRETHSTYCNNISKVYGFSFGRDSDDMEVYLFYGENSAPDGDGLLYFFILKALGLNDITIIY